MDCPGGSRAATPGRDPGQPFQGALLLWDARAETEARLTISSSMSKSLQAP